MRALKNNGVHFAGVSSPRNARTKYLLAQGKPRFSAAHPYLPIPRLTEGVKTARIKQSLGKGITALLPFSLDLRKAFAGKMNAALKYFLAQAKPCFCDSAPQFANTFAFGKRVNFLPYILCVPLKRQKRGGNRRLVGRVLPFLSANCFNSLKQKV